jgi:phosphatidylglycerol:prolipoprotein diacylglycerol transferase
MCSELFRIPYVWGGVPMFGFGVLLAVWAVVSVGTLVAMVRRHGFVAETFSYVPVLLLAGAAIAFLPRVFPDGLPIRGFGSMVLVGAVAGVGLAVYRARNVGVSHELILSLAFWMFVFGMIGGRLFYVIEYWDRSFSGQSLPQTLLAILNFPAGGLVIYGALFGGLAAFLWFGRAYKLPPLAMADLIAPSLVVGLAFGRIGCFLNGCCFGGPAEVPWAVTFPQGSPPYEDQLFHGDMYGFRLSDLGQRPVVGRVDAGTPAAQAGLAAGDEIVAINGFVVTTLDQAEAALGQLCSAQQPVRLQLASGRTVALPAAGLPPRSLPVHPTQLYSAISAALLGWFLWTYYPLRRRDGEVIALLLTIYPIARFLLEIIRVDESPVFGTGLSISQNISLVLLVGAIGLWSYVLGRPRGVVDWSREHRSVAAQH